MEVAVGADLLTENSVRGRRHADGCCGLMGGSRRRSIHVQLLHTSFELQVPQLVGRRPGGGDWDGFLRRLSR